MRLFAGKRLLTESEQYPEIKDPSVFTDEFVRKYFNGIDSVKKFAEILADKLKDYMVDTDDGGVDDGEAEIAFDAASTNKWADKIYVSATPGDYDMESEPYDAGDYWTPPSGGYSWVEELYSFEDVWVYFEFDTAPYNAKGDTGNYVLYDLHVADILNPYLPKRKSRFVKEGKGTSMVKLLTQKKK